MSPATWDALALLLLIVGPPAFLLGLRLILAAGKILEGVARTL